MVSVLDRGYIRLCDDLSLRPEGSLSRTTSESLAPPLVVLARQESSHSPDVMLFAIRAITYLCEAHPRSSRRMHTSIREDFARSLTGVFTSWSYWMISRLTVGRKLGEAVPVLCNLLNYEDQKLVEHAASSLMRIVSNVRKSSEMVDEICKHGLIHQVVRFIASSSGTKTILSQSIYEQSQNKQPYSQMIHEVIDLLNVLLPPVSNEGEDDKEISESKERIIIASAWTFLRQFGADVLPVLVQLVNSCADLDVCYGCLSVIDKIVVHFSRSVVLVDLLKVFLDSFMKEGIVYAINALVTPMQTSNGKMAENDENTCLCYTYSRNNQTSPSDGETCMLEENSVPTLAKHITDKYFNTATQCSSLD
ncbi:hypothetical protein IFM89_007134 [Coptis chinensis]|uniref:HECT-type E3 ubiquitin transferase n=1 Tax=Coptis chinensis TaxID=261450 RepID=A0A835LQR0_9MAGN|nr:hypothetical protein IFM89_007134 [Coptis chinensis]